MPAKIQGEKTAKKSKSKRKANSPLSNDSGCALCSGQQQDAQVRCTHSIKNRRLINQVAELYASPSNTVTYQNQDPNSTNMSAPNNFGMMTSPSQFNYGYPNTPSFANPGAPQMQNTQPASNPTWLSPLMEEIKSLTESSKKVEQTVSSINKKVTDIETKFEKFESRLTDMETACGFLNEGFESQKGEIKSAKDDLSKLQKTCTKLQENQAELQKHKFELNAKLIDLETRSMNENLIFYGIKEETEKENCEELVKNFIENNLKIDSSDIKLDRVHRLGSNHAKKPRAMITKFHDYKQREMVRQKSFEDNIKTDLNAANRGVGIQRPYTTREARRTFADITKTLKEQGRSVRQQGINLLVDGRLHKVFSDGKVIDPPPYLTPR